MGWNNFNSSAPAESITFTVDRIPYELWTGHKPNYEKLRIFESEAYVYLAEVKRSKLETKAQKVTFVGYSDEYKGYRFLDWLIYKITISRDARFIELRNGSEQQEESDFTTEKQIEENIVKILEVAKQPNLEEILEVQSEFEEDVFYDSEDTSPISDLEELEPTLNRRYRRNRGALPQRYSDYIVGVATHDADEPMDYKMAMKDPKWRQAMEDELKSHEKNKTWELVHLPQARNLLVQNGFTN